MARPRTSTRRVRAGSRRSCGEERLRPLPNRSPSGDFVCDGCARSSGRIPLIRDGLHVPKAAVLDQWRSTLCLRDAGLNARGWLLELMRCVEAIRRAEFTLADVYAFEPRLAALYPGNSNVRPKIRQQLQVLRDRGWLAFGDRRGTYRRAG